MSACRSSAGRLFHSFGQTERQTACLRMYTHSLVTLKRVYTVIASTCRQLLRDLSDTSQTSANGCPSTVSGSTWTRLSCYELDRGTVSLSKAVVFQYYSTSRFWHHYSSVGSHIFVRSQSRATRVDCQRESATAFIGYGGLCIVNVHLRRYRPQHSYLHSCRHALITATLSWHLRRKWLHVDKLQRVLVVTGTSKFHCGMSWRLRSGLHWLGVPRRVMFKLSVMMFGCVRGQAPQYLSEHCLSVSDVTPQQHLRSAGRRLLVVQRYIGWVCSVEWPSLWLVRWSGNQLVVWHFACSRHQQSHL